MMMNTYLSRGQYTIDSAFIEKTQAILYTTDLTEFDKKLADDDIISVFKAVDELAKELALVKLENECFEHFLEVNDPAQLIAIREKTAAIKKPTAIKFASDIGEEGKRSMIFRSSRIDRMGPPGFSEDTGYMSGRSSHIRPRRDVSVSSNYPDGSYKSEASINYVMKRELAEKFIFKIEQESKEIETAGKREIIRLNAIQKELELRIADVEETASSLEEIVVSSKQGSWGFKIPSERFIKYCQSWQKNGLALMGAIRIRINALNRQWKQQKAVLVRKIDLSGALMPVDFDLMTISRNKYDKMLDEKTTYLINLKQHTGKTSSFLAAQKKNLMILENSLRAIDMEVEMTKKNIEAIRQEKVKVVKEIQISRENLFELDEQVSIYEAPSIKSYIRIKQTLHNLQKEEKLLQRQNYILGIKLQNAKRKYASKSKLRSGYK